MSVWMQKLIEKYQSMEEKKLKGDQHKLDHDKDGDIDGADFAALRNKKKKKDVAEAKDCDCCGNNPCDCAEDCSCKQESVEEGYGPAKKTYRKPTQAEIDADRKKDQKGKPRPNMMRNKTFNKMYGNHMGKLKDEQKEATEVEEAHSDWHVTFKTAGHKPQKVKARNSAEAIRKAAKAAQKAHATNPKSIAMHKDVKKVTEGTDAYGKSVQKVADKKKKDAMTQSDKDKLGKLSNLMKRANEDSEEVVMNPKKKKDTKDKNTEVQTQESTQWPVYKRIMEKNAVDANAVPPEKMAPTDVEGDHISKAAAEWIKAHDGNQKPEDYVDAEKVMKKNDQDRMRTVPGKAKEPK